MPVQAVPFLTPPGHALLHHLYSFGGFFLSSFARSFVPGLVCRNGNDGTSFDGNPQDGISQTGWILRRFTDLICSNSWLHLMHLYRYIGTLPPI